MRTIILKHIFVYFFILFSLTFSFNSCSDNDDEPQTFLEKYYETLWVNTEDVGEYTEYFKFVSKSKIVLEIRRRRDWNNEDCFTLYYEGSNDELIKVIENSPDKLVFESTWDNGGDLYTDIITITVSGNIMKLIWFDDYDIRSDTVFLEKSSVNVDDLKMCN